MIYQQSLSSIECDQENIGMWKVYGWMVTKCLDYQKYILKEYTMRMNQAKLASNWTSGFREET